MLQQYKRLNAKENYRKIFTNGEDLYVYQKDNRIIFEKQKVEIADIWEDNGYYSNLEILKNITPTYGVECKNDNIIELMKYRSKIILTLL